MTQLETDLRAAFHEHAARVHASPELLATDYHPRSRRVWAPAAIGAGLAVAAGTLTAALTLTGGASNAFAGWTPKPTKPTASQLAAADTFCSQNMPDPGLPLQLSEARGPFTFEIYSNGTSNDFCTTGPSFTNASGWSTSSPVTVDPGKLFLWAEHTSIDYGSGRTAYFVNGQGGRPTSVAESSSASKSTDTVQAYTSVIAQAGDGVSDADLTLSDGSQVTATVDNGWAVAWWPGTAHLVSAQLTTPSGTQTQTFSTGSCATHNCNGGGSRGGRPGGG